jgi:hypothetical protein
MADVAYKQYLIVSVPVFDALTLTWRPSVTVSWKIDGHREQHTLTSLPNLFHSAQNAEYGGVRMAKEWIDSIAKQP